MYRASSIIYIYIYIHAYMYTYFISTPLGSMNVGTDILAKHTAISRARCLKFTKIYKKLYLCT